jgi:hypothetical protein
MQVNYKTEAVAKLAQEIKAEGFRVFIAENGTHGFYTDAEGSRLTSFQYDLGGFKFFGNYKSNQPLTTGTGWEVLTGSFKDMFAEHPPQWAARSSKWAFTTLEQYQKTYQASSRFKELM